ncbi:MAG: hypothetical protein IT384_24130 [Deltaproteobacteria bacterium]|nr:hypothetical protein [Deltaproteobacteria bacterium]
MIRHPTSGFLVLWLSIGAAGCGSQDSSHPDAAINGCPTHDQPTFELGTGAEHYGPLAPEQTLKMAVGPQGGCHFWLAVRTDGFAERLFRIEYELFFADTGTTTQDTSSQNVRLVPLDDGTGRCEYAGYTAFIVRPISLVGKRIRIDVDVQDSLGARASASTTVLAEWPDVAADRCGKM